MIHQVILVGAALFAIVACRSSGSDEGDGTPLPDTARVGDGSATVPATPTCGVREGTTLTGDGIGDLRIGSPVERMARSCGIARDTTVPGIEGTLGRRIVVDLGRDTVSAVIASNRVWRLHARTPVFRTSDSLGVGIRG